MTTQDFKRNIDFTTLPSNIAAGGDHNNLVDLTEPQADSASTGKGLTLFTTDTGLNVPDVPDPTVAGYSKWVRYIWIRAPFAGSGAAAKLYTWNPETTHDAILLFWQLQTADIVAIDIAIAAATAASTTADTNASNAVATANAASTVATTANTNATTAAANALSALNTGTAAQSTANTALANAASAVTTANAASAVANANVPVSKLTPGTTPGMTYRANATNAAMEFFNPTDNYAMLSEIKAAGDSAKNSAGVNASVVWIGAATSYRIINTINVNGVVNGTAMVVLDATTGIFTLQKGTYYVRAKAACNANAGAIKHTLTVKNVSAASWVLTGFPCVETATNANKYAEVLGYLTPAGTTQYALDHIFDTARAAGIGSPANSGPGVFQEYYCTLEIVKLQ